MIIKKALLIGVTMSVLSFGLATAATAAEEKDNGSPFPGEFSATLTGASQYIFRGVTQTSQKPAAQGSFDWSHATGLYAGVWASNVDFKDNDSATLEVDYYGGFSNSIKALSYDLGFIYYSYPGAADSLNYDYWELAFNAGYDFKVAEVSAGVYYSPDFFAASGDAVYYSGDVSVPLPMVPFDLSVVAHVGHQNIENNVAFAASDYTDWNIGATVTLASFDLDLRYNANDEDLTGDNDIIFSVSRSF